MWYVLKQKANLKQETNHATTFTRLLPDAGQGANK
jgi:hypothetical protein